MPSALEPTPAADTAPPSEAVRRIHETILAHVAGGYDSRERVVEDATAVAAQWWQGGDAAVFIAREVDSAFAEQAKAEATWKGITDCDKIDRALAALERKGILARPHFKGSQETADAAIHDEVGKARAAGKKVRGWVYWNETQTWEVLQTKELALIFGAPSLPPDERWAALAREILQAFKAEGLSADWPYQNAAYPVILKNLDWKRRAMK